MSARALVWRPFNRFHVALAGLRGRGGDARGPLLLVQLGKIGDFVLTTPLIRALASDERPLVLVVNPSAAALAETCPAAAEVVTVGTRIGTRHAAANLVAVHRAGAVLRRLRPAAALVPKWSADLQFESALAALSGAPMRVGFAEAAEAYRARRNVHYDHLFTHTSLGRPGEHEAIQPLALLEHLGLTPAGSALELWVTDEDEAFAKREIDAPELAVALAPGAGSPHRTWPADRFAEVAAALHQSGLRAAIVGGPEDRAAAAVITRVVPTALDLTGRLTLRQTAAVLARCRLLVANDSAPAHMAAAMGTPVVQIAAHPEGAPVGHDNAPQRFRPLGVPAVVLQPQARSGCERGCVAAAPHCITVIDVGAVVDAARRLLVPGGAVAPTETVTP